MIKTPYRLYSCFDSALDPSWFVNHLDDFSNGIHCSNHNHHIHYIQLISPPQHCHTTTLHIHSVHRPIGFDFDCILSVSLNHCASFHARIWMIQYATAIEDDYALICSFMDTCHWRLMFSCAIKIIWIYTLHFTTKSTHPPYHPRHKDDDPIQGFP